MAAEASSSEPSSSAPVYAYSKTYQRTSIANILGADDGGKSLAGTQLRVGGWVKTGREAGAGAWAFLELNDGTCFSSLQAVVTKEVAEPVGGLRKIVSTGTSVLLEGVLERTPEGTKQAVELKATKVIHLGTCDASTYPMAKKSLPFEFLREKAHLRARTNTIGAVARIRNALAFATHKFFQEHGFLYVHTPIITASDCEGAGEMFQITTLLGHLKTDSPASTASGADLDSLKQQLAAQADKVKAAKKAAAADGADKATAAAAVKAEVEVLTAIKDQIKAKEEEALWVGGLKRTPAGELDYHDDFFSKPAFLTVSGQLNAEYYACALTSVYTFGPTFRAEKSFTGRHLSEFWMIEPEIAFADLQDDMNCAEDYVRFCCRHLLQCCAEDLSFITKMIDKTAVQRLQQVVDTPFKRISYSEAIELLQAEEAKGHAFIVKVEWGMDLGTEHERYITENIFCQPVIVYNYPKDIKAFYMKQNEDGRTVAAMDVLVPKVGELIGGSQREDSYEALTSRMAELDMDLVPYEGYLDLRKYGSVPHAGFGLGFERLIMFATGIENIRDVIPFPRWCGNAAF